MPGARHALLVALMMGVTVLVCAGATMAAPLGGTAQTRSLQVGETLYAEHCASCHGLGGVGTPQGSGLINVGAAAVDFMLTTGRMPMADPHQPSLRRPRRFTQVEIDALIAYITSLGPGGPPIPRVTPERGALALGAQLFVNNCAPCHGADGQGASVGEGQVAPSLHVATPTQIAEAVRIGPGAMPRFSPAVLTSHDFDSLVRYVLFLQHAPDRGGMGLGHEGPVIEGFVAWVAGLGLIVLATRFIGTTE